MATGTEPKMPKLDQPEETQGTNTPAPTLERWPVGRLPLEVAEQKAARKECAPLREDQNLYAILTIGWASTSLKSLSKMFETMAELQALDKGVTQGQFAGRCRKIDTMGPDIQVDIVKRFTQFLSISNTADEIIKMSPLRFFDVFAIDDQRKIVQKLNRRNASPIAKAIYKLLPSPSNESSKAANHAVTVGGGEPAVAEMQKLPVTLIDEFPGCLGNIKELIKKATISVNIMVDCIDFGGFSNADLHHEMNEAICNARRTRKIPVQMLITEEPAPISRGSPYYGIGLNELKKDDEFAKTWKSYLEYHGDLEKETQTDEGAFIKILQDNQEIYRKSLIKARVIIYGLDGKRIQECKTVTKLHREDSKKAGSSPHKADVFFWIVDGTEAIFLLSSSTPHGWKMAFQTKNPDLVNKLIGIFEQHPYRP